MENTARVAGYAIALTVLGVLLALVLLLQDGRLFKGNRVRVLFPSIGTLMEDDPVKLYGVEVGRVDRIEHSPEGPVATLELYHDRRLPADSRFVNYNYSLFGSRMVVLLKGSSPEALDPGAVQPGLFSNGVSETIHRVDELLRTMIEYKGLSARLEKGGGGSPSLSELLTTRIYPALEEFGGFARELEELQGKASGGLAGAARMSGDLNRAAISLSRGTDSMVIKTGRVIEQVSLITAQSAGLLEDLDKLLAAARDTNRTTGKLLRDRRLYEKTMGATRTLQSLFKLLKQEGVEDVIHFWRNVRIRKKGEAPR